MNGAAGKGRLRELDALRGIAAIAVVLFHYSVRFHELFPRAPHVPVALMIGHYAVLLFFAISGFVIAFSLSRVEGVGDFAVRRFARLFPAYWAAMALTLIVEYGAGVRALWVSPAAILANMGMMQGFLFLPGVDGVYWTLEIELSFYISMALLWRVGLLRRTELVLAFWLALHWANDLYPFLPSRLALLMVVDPIPFFAIGMIAHRLWSGERHWREQLPIAAWLLLVVGLSETADILAVAAGLLALFAALARGRIGFLTHPLLLWFGAISYALYLVHHNIGFVAILLMERAGAGPWMAAAGASMLAIALASGLHYLVEEPAARIIARRWHARRSAASPRIATAA